MSHEETLQQINDSMVRLGDLPIFSATVNRVRRVTADPESDAMALAQEVMKDASLATKLLRLANSPYYNRGVGKIGVVSRAVILLGFDTIKSLCLTLKIIESFCRKHPTIDLDQLLVNAYLSAGFVREIAEQSGVKDVEQSYICGLIHNLGEITVANFLPDKYREMRARMDSQGLSWNEAQQAVLGTTLDRIARDLASAWEFPASVVQTLRPYHPDINSPVRNRAELNHALASLSSELMGTVYGSRHGSDLSYPELMRVVADSAGIGTAAAENCLTGSFKMACDLAESYGLDRKLLKPAVTETEDETRDKVARMFSYYASNLAGANAPDMEPAIEPAAEDRAGDDGPVVADAAGTVTAPVAARAPDRGHIQLELIQEITSLIASGVGLQVIFAKVLDGIHAGVGFDRAILCLLSTDRRSYSGRVARGKDTDRLKDYFNFRIDPKHDLFSKVIMERNDLLVSDIHDANWKHLIKEDFASRTGANAFGAAAVHAMGKPIGMIYADKAASAAAPTDDDYRGFLQFVTQARLALQFSEMAKAAK